MKIYTRKGDAGQTSIWGGRRIAKDEARIEAMGAVDECNAAIGLAAACELPAEVSTVLETVHECLFAINCELMAPDATGPGASIPRPTSEDVTRLEAAMDDLDQQLPELRNFIHPGGTLGAANLHLARTICRRAERRVTTLRRSEHVSAEVPAYLNRLADLLFVLARYVNHSADIPDARWAPRE